MRRARPLQLVASADGAVGTLASGLVDDGRPIICPACSELSGIEVFASVTIAPTKARRRRNGQLVLDEQHLVCARCRDRGVSTRL